MTSPLARLLAPVACAAALVPLLVAGPAAADTEVKTDPRGDVSEVRGRQLAPRPSADVLQLRSRHENGRIAMQVVVADLDTNTPTGTNFGVATANGQTFLAGVQRDEEGMRSVLLVDERTGLPVDCPSLEGAVFPAADRITVSIPRLCLGRPRWVRTGAVTSGVVEPFLLTYADDARRDGTIRGSSPFIGTRRLFLN